MKAFLNTEKYRLKLKTQDRVWRIKVKTSPSKQQTDRVKQKLGRERTDAVEGVHSPNPCVEVAGGSVSLGASPVPPSSSRDPHSPPRGGTLFPHAADEDPGHSEGRRLISPGPSQGGSEQGSQLG